MGGQTSFLQMLADDRPYDMRSSNFLGIEVRLTGISFSGLLFKEGQYVQ